ncbi:MAG TPA: AAA family ATPase [Allosphingosinicella sp.]|nr:AAA family ATPase [Allosphingosinicella sp.]
MAKHTPQSLLERAAEMYDFGAALRAPAAAPAPKPAPEPAPEPVPIVELVPPAPVVEALTPVVEIPAPRPRPVFGVAEVDRVALAEAGFIVPEGDVTGIAEEFRLVKHQLLAAIEGDKASPDERRRAVLICSAQPKSGKTFCAVNLALSLAGERDVEVLLIDGDFPKPDVLATLGVAGNRSGLVEALADPSIDIESLIIRTDVPGLSVLPAGRKTNNVPELLASDRTREVLAKLVAGDGRRIILFDSPPALMASHATVLAGHVGQALVVVRADQTTEADLRETLGLLSGCDHLSLILNGAGLAVTGRKFGAYDGYGHDE